MMTKKFKIPRSFVQEDIIRYLASQKKATFTELQKYLDVSRTTLSTHLAQLQVKEYIEFTRKGREKYYNLKEHPVTHLEKKIMVMSTHYKLDFIMDLEERGNKVNIKDEFKNIGDWLSSYFLFLILKSLDTGEDWTDSFNKNDFVFIITNYILSLLFNKETVRISELPQRTNEQIGYLFQNMHDLVKSKNVQKKLNFMKDELEELHIKNSNHIDTIMNTWIKQID